MCLALFLSVTEEEHYSLDELVLCIQISAQRNSVKWRVERSAAELLKDDFATPWNMRQYEVRKEVRHLNTEVGHGTTAVRIFGKSYLARCLMS